MTGRACRSGSLMTSDHDTRDRDHRIVKAFCLDWQPESARPRAAPRVRPVCGRSGGAHTGGLTSPFGGRCFEAPRRREAAAPVEGTPWTGGVLDYALESRV